MAPLTKEVNVALAIAAIVLVRRRRRREFGKGRLWVRPYINEKEEHGAFYVLLPALREREDAMYRNFLRMPVNVYDWLLDKITKKDATYRAVIVKLTVALVRHSDDYVK